MPPPPDRRRRAAPRGASHSTTHGRAPTRTDASEGLLVRLRRRVDGKHAVSGSFASSRAPMGQRRRHRLSRSPLAFESIAAAADPWGAVVAVGLETRIALRRRSRSAVPNANVLDHLCGVTCAAHHTRSVTQAKRPAFRCGPRSRSKRTVDAIERWLPPGVLAFKRKRGKHQKQRPIADPTLFPHRHAGSAASPRTGHGFGGDG
jgi:hypothetical protein